MELLRSGLKSVLGAPQPGSQPTGAETIERLIERLQLSTLLEDRRDACRAIKALSRKFRVEVGAQCMDSLVHVLQGDRGDMEILGYALDTLCNVVTPEVFEEEAEGSDAMNSEQLSTVGEQFTEIFIKKMENVTAVLSLLEEYDFHVRWPSVRLLTNLLSNKPKEIQEMVLVSPMGVAKLVDLLSDSREVIRNDGLLLLVQLTRANANIQKIVAFENAFDRVLDVIVEEGFSEGGIVVEDCLNLLINLLKNNASNQTFFKEGSYIQRLTPFFTLPAEISELGWSAQKVSNVLYMLSVIRILVSPGNPAHVLSQCQRSMHICGILESLCSVLMASGIPADVLTETVITVAELIRGCQVNQEYFAAVLAPSVPPRPAIVVLLLSMVNEKQPFSLRCAVLYCFESFLYRNDDGQNQIVQTLLPSSNDAPSITSGQLLCGGLFSPEPISQWLSAVALSHALVDNPLQKDQLLRVQLATAVGMPPVSLLHQCITLLQKSSDHHAEVGILMLLCHWVSHSPQAVAVLLSSPVSVSYLTAQVRADEHDENQEVVQGVSAFLLGLCVLFNDNSVPEFSKERLGELLSKRVGLEMFLDKLSEVSKNEYYSRISKHPQLNVRQPSTLLYDHEFCRLFKALEGVVIKTLTPKPASDLGFLSVGGDENDSPIVEQYKEFIREQDQQINTLKNKLQWSEVEQKKSKLEIEELMNSNDVLRDQNALLHAQQGSIERENTKTDNEPLLLELGQLQHIVGDLHSQLHHKEVDFHALEQVHQTEIESLKQEISSLAIKLEEQQCVLNQEKHQEREIVDHAKLKKELEDAVRELLLSQEELQKLRKDQDDLLELLTDQDGKILEYKRRLKDLGQKVDEDDDELLDGIDVEEDILSASIT